MTPLRVLNEDPIESGVGDFVHPADSHERIAPDALHERLSANDQTRLGPSQQLVAAEANQIYACPQGVRYDWLAREAGKL